MCLQKPGIPLDEEWPTSSLWLDLATENNLFWPIAAIASNNEDGKRPDSFTCKGKSVRDYPIHVNSKFVII